MSRYIRRTVALCKIETTEGTDAVPTGADNALLISNVSIQEQPQNVDRDLIRGYMGASEQLAGSRSLQVSFDVEIAGAGVVADIPAWDPLIRACGFAGAENAAESYEYNPVTDGHESATIYYYDDKVLHKLLGAKGTVTFAMGVGERPLMSFTMTGLDGGATAAANATPTLTSWKVPQVVTDVNSTTINLGCTLATSALAGGTEFVSNGLSIDVANAVNFTPLIGAEYVDISDRQTTCQFGLDLTAAEEVTARTAVLANTLSSVGFVHGTTAGNIVLIFMPAVQRTNPKKIDANGRRMIQYDGRVTPSAGNDELTIVVK